MSLAYPLGDRGRLIGRPGAGTHSYTEGPNNWQSDRAIDIAVKRGTPVYAITDGVIAKTGGQANETGRFGGFNLTLSGDDDQFFYGHLSKLRVQPGQKVRQGDVIGWSGAANGVEHLHLGFLKADPLGITSESVAKVDSGGPVQAAADVPGSVLDTAGDAIPAAADIAAKVVDAIADALGLNIERAAMYALLTLAAVLLLVVGLARTAGVTGGDVRTGAQLAATKGAKV